MEILGIDIGGSGIKGAIVDVQTGELITERHRIPTPFPATPQDVAETVKEIVDHFNWVGKKVGCGFPAVVQNGIIRTAANIDESWIGVNADNLLSQTTGSATILLNDADAAGIAEMNFGAGKGHKGVVIMITIGTGLGTAIFSGGQLLPNTELGHIKMKHGEAEDYASAATRELEDLSWKHWGKRFNKYLRDMNAYFWPDLFILGGGASKKFDKYEHKLDEDINVVPAEMLNNAGIIGAALNAENKIIR